MGHNTHTQTHIYLLTYFPRTHTGILWKCCKVFCALAVTVKRSVGPIIYALFSQFSEGQGVVGSFGSFGLCFEGDD